MNVRSTTDLPATTAADTIAVGVFEDEGIAHDVDGALQALVDSGEARRGLRKLAVTHAGSKRWILVGLGRRDEFDPERARVAAAAAAARDIAESHSALTCDVWGRREIEEAGMGAFAAVARGSDEEPALITVRYEPGDVAGPPLGFVGKAVTFDSG